MTKKQLLDVALFHLENFKKDSATVVNDETPINTILDGTGGFGPANAKAIFRNVIRWTVKKNKRPDKPWPRNWAELTAKGLVESIFILLIVLLPVTGRSQLEVNVSSIRTENNNNALQIGLTYIRSLDSMFKAQDILVPMSSSLFALTPEFTIRTGTADAFSSITAKATGMFMFFGTTKVNGIVTPNTAKPFTVIPLSVGVETNNQFSKANVILETGFIPWYQSGPVADWIKRTKIGVFAQTGYKMNWIDPGTAPQGGQIDESEEEPNEFILRLKASGASQIATPVKMGAVEAGLIGAGDLWFDVANRAVYYRYDATLRFYLAPDRYLDLVYQKGSGAPNFNQGDQFGVGLSITF